MSPARCAALSAAITALLGSSCVGDTPENPISAPDISRLTVFFPLDEGLVNGRGSPGPTPGGYQWVFIRPHPSRNLSTFARVQPDGSFTFRIAATGDDILEMAYAESNDEKADRGAPSFVQVPPRTAAGQSYFCCIAPGAMKGRCQETTTPVCRAMSVFSECTDDGECSYLSRDTIPIGTSDFTVSQPTAAGTVTVTSNNPAYALHLVRFENRGQRAVGGDDPRIRDYVIADEQGRASTTMRARGDDEIVVRLFNIDGYTKSREHAMYVPDADFSGVDVVGVFPFEGLRDGESGMIGVRLAPYGLDGRGICAPSNEEPGPALCFSGGHEVPDTGRNSNFNGGLDYENITVRLTMGNGVDTPINPPPREMRVARNTKFTDGNVLAPPQAVVLIIDHSEEAPDRDGQVARFRAAENFLRSARGRDQIAVIATGAHGEAGANFGVRANLTTRAQAIDALFALEIAGPAGVNDVYGAVAAAGDMLAQQARGREGRILIISATNPVVDPVKFDDALISITGDDAAGRPRYPTYVVGLPICDRMAMGTCRPLPSETATFESLSGFTEGRFVEIPVADDYLTSVTTVTGAISGAFVLMYQIQVPNTGNGKTTAVRLDITVRVPDPLNPTMIGATQEQSTRYEGIIELRDNLGN